MDDTSFTQPPEYHHYDVVQMQTTTAPHQPPAQQWQHQQELPLTSGPGGRRDSVKSDATIHSTKEEAPVILMEDEV